LVTSEGRPVRFHFLWREAVILSEEGKALREKEEQLISKERLPFRARGKVFGEAGLKERAFE